MHPVLFYINDFPIHTYGVLVGLGVLGGVSAAVFLGVKEAIPASYLWDLALIILFGALTGSRLEYVRTHWADFANDPVQILAIRDGGLVFYGGLVLTMVLMVGYLWLRKLNILQVLDIYGALVPLGHAVGRLGCLAAGCCYGLPTTRPWGVVFPEGGIAPSGIALHPTQAYEAGYNLLLGMILLGLLAKRQAGKLPNGAVFGVFLILYAGARALNEQFRGDLERGIAFWGLSNAQATALGMAIIGAFVLASRQWGLLRTERSAGPSQSGHDHRLG
jgi:phosphatidylglycerol:prolipoprotein diacylglycerol transferase